MSHPPIISIVGKSNAGKTTLVEKLVPWLVKRGLKVGTVKHDVHGFEMDRAGKDSYRHKHAGATASIISSPNQIGMVMDVDHDHTIQEVAERFYGHMDIIVTEGYKRESWPKIEIHRKELQRSLLATPDQGLIGLVTDEPMPVDVPHFGLDDGEALADFVIEYHGL
jgi:molybdopterin-guanine dinucleotide biosynthesis adapter protein